MNTHMKFMFKDMRSARKGWKAMLTALVEYRHIRFMARDDAQLGKLKPATVFQSTESLHEGYKGIFIGAGLGLLAGLLALAFPPWYVETHWIVILAITTLTGIVTGAIGMAMLGVNLASDDVKRYRQRIDEGGVLMLVTVPQDRSAEICRLMQKPQLNQSLHFRLPTNRMRTKRHSADNAEDDWENISRLFS